MAKTRKKKRHWKISVGIVMLVLAIMVALAGLNYYGTFLYENINEVIPGRGIVEVSKNATYEDLCNAVVESGALDNPNTFLRAARFLKLKDNFKPGCYRLVRGMNNKAIVRTFACGWQEPVQLTFNSHVRSLERLSGILGEKLEADSAAFAKVLLDPQTARAYGFQKETFLSMFIPNTYEVYWTITPDNFVSRMFKEWEAFWTEERTQKAEAMGLSKTDVSTLASIVVEETRFTDEMPIVAGVYINRLHKRIPLQADPTVKFLVREEGVTRILNRHLKIDSPYNTYKYRGLPPGPITMPSIAAIDAVLNYTHHHFYYFCARATFDGRHEFASSYNDHVKNANAYHAAYKQWEKERAEAQAVAALESLVVNTESTSAPGA